MVEDRRGDDQLVRLGLLDEGLQLRPHALARTDEGAGQHALRLRLLRAGPIGLDVVDRLRQQATPAAQHVGEALLHRSEEVMRFGVRLGDDNVAADHRVGPVELGRGLEALAIDGQRVHQRIRREMRGEGVGQAEHGGELRAEQAGAENPERDIGVGARHGLDHLIRLQRSEQRLQLQHVLREALGRVGLAPQRAPGALVGAGRTAEPEVDAAGIERLQRAELLGDHDWRMVRQHDPAGPDADRFGAFGDVADRDRGRGAGDAGHIVVLGQPEAGVAEPFGMAGEVAAVVEGVCCGRPLGNEGEVEDGKREHWAFPLHRSGLAPGFVAKDRQPSGGSQGRSTHARPALRAQGIASNPISHAVIFAAALLRDFSGMTRGADSTVSQTHQKAT
ncbi:conserved hypothetical protein [Bosea sp. 62]|nr:conserved hypothetical protein [Bosea sp. 21B]CAD5298122.1 conserved hypothetical protein [Bosea sp. 7B]VVT61001.1 conserved hypothetical protein [Bosea sp. EC-HK365B]VXB33215.1 conserved hypothetical protein [Bosea sp. 127]VXB60015.1 conserved hypothetical protein [Bosea sp. 125]VXC89279.1 conserved hypothetical protein [Bosea sp. 62]